MPVINSFTHLHPQITEWRRDIHANPELGFDTHRTSALVAEKLRAFGCDDVTEGIGRTGVVGVIKGKTDTEGRVIGLRADMDALPINEATGLDYASSEEGKMHACGHDGHTAMLLGTASYLAETRNFDGTAVVIFQPAEEGGGGGNEMVKDGLMDRWGIQEVYAIHNYPGMPVGVFGTRSGPLLAATDEFTITINGVGGHAALPHLTVDPIVIGSQVVTAVQAIVSRATNPLKSAVVSVTTFDSGVPSYNVIPDTVVLQGTVRTLDAEVRESTENRLRKTVEGIVSALGATVEIKYKRGYPVTKNHDDQTAFAAKVASEIVGEDNVLTNVDPIMGGEDFSYMLEARPGAFMFFGNGPSAMLHHPKYNFNDEIIPIGCSYFARIIEKAMPAE